MVEEVENLKTLIKMLPLWSTGIFLGTPIGIFNSLTVLQALTMDTHVPRPSFQNLSISPSSFLVFNLIASSISISISDRSSFPRGKI